MTEESKRYQYRKIMFAVIHAVFLALAAAGISAMYLNSGLGKGLTWVYDEQYEDSEQFAARLEQDIEKIFNYVAYRDVFETRGKVDLNKTIVGISDGPGLSEELTLDQIIRYAKTRGYYLDENFTVQGVPMSMDDDSEDVTIDWQSYNPSFLDRDVYSQRMTKEDLALDVLDHLGDYYSIYHNYIEQETNLHFRISYQDGNGKERIYTNASGWTLDELRSCGRYLYIPGNSIEMDSNLTDVPVNVAPYLEMWNPYDNNQYYLVIAVDTTYPYVDAYSREAVVYSGARDNFILGMVGVILGMLGGLATLAILVLMSGHVLPDHKETRVYPIDQVKTESGILIWAAGLGAALLLGRFIGSRLIVLFFREDQWQYWNRLLSVLIIYAASALGFFGLVRRYKAGTLWSNSMLRRILGSLQDYLNNLSFAVGIGIVFFSGLLVNVALIWGMMAVYGIPGKSLSYKIGFFLMGILLVLVDLWIFHHLFVKSVQRDQLSEAILSISQGNTNLQMDLSKLSGKEREMGEHINHISVGLGEALQEQVKSERLKADLITNVSHDIKTPLTSIISYVDLIKRENIQDPRVQEYLEVLEQKSQRLKNLTEDLVEASKASSGNLKLDMQDIDFVELVNQTNGEFAERFEQRHLELIASLPKEALVIQADGRRLWRVLENLYNNTCKYAMERSRVYIDVVSKDGQAVFSIKNISESSLNISPDELTERFVRGDGSRTTEGSGLGLSIAKSLTTLQNGVFELVIDGDLFKAVVSFPLK